MDYYMQDALSSISTTSIARRTSHTLCFYPEIADELTLLM